MNRIIRSIVSRFKWFWVWTQYNIAARIRVPFAMLRARNYKVIERKEPDFKLVPIPSQSVTELVFGENYTFLAPNPLINLEDNLIVAIHSNSLRVNELSSDGILMRIVKVERPPIVGAIWTAVVEWVGAPLSDRKASNLIVIPFDSLVSGYRLVEATKKEENVYARTERPGNW